MLRVLAFASVLWVSSGYRRWCRGTNLRSYEKQWCCRQYNLLCEETEYSCSHSRGRYWDRTERKQYCCREERVGCDGLRAECISGNIITAEQQTFCCDEMNIGCTSTPAPTFSCDLENLSYWSSTERNYCCSVRSVGCSSDCTAPPATWSSDQQQWCCPALSAIGQFYSEDQKHWCCSNKGLGCGYIYYDCYNTDKLTWSDNQRNWCCRERFVCTATDVCYQNSITETQELWCCNNRSLRCRYDCSGSNANWGNSQKTWCCDQMSVCEEAYSCTNLERPETTQQERDFCCTSRSIGCTDICTQTADSLRDFEKEWCCTTRNLHCTSADLNCDASVHTLSAADRAVCCSTRNIGCSIVEVALTSQITGTDYSEVQRNPIAFVTTTRNLLLESVGSSSVEVIITKIHSMDAKTFLMVPKEWNSQSATNRRTSIQQGSSVVVEYTLIGVLSAINTAAQGIRKSVSPSHPPPPTVVVSNYNYNRNFRRGRRINNNNNNNDDEHTAWKVVLFVSVALFLIVIVAFGCLVHKRRTRRQREEYTARRNNINNNNNNNSNSNNNSNNNNNNTANDTNTAANRQSSPSPPLPPSPSPPAPLSNFPDKECDVKDSDDIARL